MTQRPYWRGHITLSLVSFPVHVYTALEKESKTVLHEIDRVTKERIRRQNVAGEKNEAVDPADIVKGYEYEPGKHITITPEELAALRLPSKDAFELVRFVDIDAIDPAYFEKPYFVVPANNGAASPFAVIREALRREKKAGIGQLSAGGREHLCALKACDGGMILEILRYADEMRDAGKIFGQIPKVPVDKTQLELARQLIAKNSGPFEPKKFHDRYEKSLRQLVDAKRQGKKLPAPAEPPKPPAKIIDLAAVLRQSLEARRPAAGRTENRARPRDVPPAAITRAARTRGAR